MNKFFIWSNWEVANGGTLENTVTDICSLQNKNCFVDNINAESCRCLIKGQNDHDIKSKPELKIIANRPIKQIDVFSEGSLIEVYGKHDDYLFTCDTRLIDDWEEFAVYHAKILLPKLSKCKLKFSWIKNSKRLWIYSIQLTTDQLHSTNFPLFNFDNVEHLLHGSNHQTLERMKKFKNICKIYNKNNYFSGGVKSLENLFTVFDQEACLKIFDTKLKLSTIQTQSEQNSTNKFSNSTEISNFSNKINSLPSQSNDFEFLKWYIAKQISDAKAEIIRHIDYKIKDLKEYNDCKFEKIISIFKEFHENSCEKK